MYLGVEILLLLGLATLIVYNYVVTLNFYNVLKNDILIKQNIIIASDLLMKSSHTTSQYVFSGNNTVIFNQVNIPNTINDLKQLITTGHFIYKEIV